MGFIFRKKPLDFGALGVGGLAGGGGGGGVCFFFFGGGVYGGGGFASLSLGGGPLRAQCFSSGGVDYLYAIKRLSLHM